MRPVSRLKIFLFTIAFAAFGIFILYAIDTVSEGWRVDHGATKNVTGADAVCKKVENAHASNDYFIPTASTTEWTAFQNNLPAGVTLNSCQFSIGNSLRFTGSANAYLSRTPGVSGNQKKWTWSAWVKRSKLSSGVQTLLSGGTDSNGNGGLVQVGFDASDRIYTYFHASTNGTATSVEVFRDPGAWYHIVVILDTAQAANADRLKIYVNGQRISVPQTIDANYSYELNGAGFPMTIGKESWVGGGAYLLDGYMADVYFIDGAAATPLTFAETDLATGSWRPKAYAGTYGTGGFHLGFSNGTSAATLAQDLSVNANHFTPWSSVAVTDQMIDSPTNNFATLNPLQTGNYSNLSNGNLRTTGNTSINSSVSVSTIGNATGKWYWEVTQGTINSEMIGVATKPILDHANLINAETTFPPLYGVGARYNGDAWGISGELQTVSGFSWWAAGDVIWIAVDADNGAVFYSKNGTWFNGGVPTSGANRTGSFSKYAPDATRIIFPTVGSYNGGYADVNFGQWGQSGLTYYPAAGGSFKYAPPAGFKALSTSNLPNTYRRYDDTVLLLNADGPNTSTVFTDSSKSRLTGTANGNAQISTVQSKFGGSSAYFDGTGDYLTFPASGNFQFGTSDFTVDTWIYPLDTTNGHLFGTDYNLGPAGIWAAQIYGSNVYWYYGNGVSYTMTNSSGITPGNWYHLAFVRKSGVLKLYVNGTNVSGAGLTDTVNYNQNRTLYVGSMNTNGSHPPFNGYIDDFRVTKGTARWSSNFTVPSTAPVAYSEQNVIEEPKQHFEAVAHTGTSFGYVNAELKFQPDLFWTKSRTTSSQHFLQDVARGFGSSKSISTSTTGYQGYNGGAPSLHSVSPTSNGYSLNGSDSDLNANNVPYADWLWKAGGTPVTNTDGTITSQVSANQAAGFSIVAYTGTSTGNGDNETVGHGLATAPKFVMVKATKTGTTENWYLWHKGFPSGGHWMAINQTASTPTNDATRFFAEPTASVLNLGWNTGVSANGYTYVAYVFAEIPGYSKFGTYKGNNSLDGPFVHTGFRPRWIMLKSITDVNGYGGSNWPIYDTERTKNNQSNRALYANAPDVEQNLSAIGIDVLSNGFKIRSTDTNRNASNDTYAYVAFADVPFGGTGITPATPLPSTPVVTQGYYSATGAFIFNDFISGNRLDYSIRTAAVNAGWDSAAPLIATVTVNAWAVVGSSASTGIAFDVGLNYPVGSSMAIINNGMILGKGGNAWSGGAYSLHSWWVAFATAGQNGGMALYVGYPTTIANNGTIAGGGGGGGGGGTASQNHYFEQWYASAGGGGGGGRGYSFGIGGASYGGSYLAAGNAGTNGTTSSAGTGGTSNVYVLTGGNGWNGGDFGMPGQAGTSGIFSPTAYGGGYDFVEAGKPGGQGGCAVYGDLYVTWAVTGTRAGCIQNSASYAFNPVISSNTTDYDVGAAAMAAGWNGAIPLAANITINAGVMVYATNTTNKALRVGSLPVGSTVTITNNGTIAGAGGAGGGSGGAGGTGWTGLHVAYPTTVANNGTISGGGGGGGGGASYALCLAYDAYTNCTISHTVYPTGGAGGTWGAGSGGGPAPYSACSSKDAYDNCIGYTTIYPSGGGTGGSQGTAWGAGSGGGGGAAGPSVVGNGNITWTPTGTRLWSVLP